MSSALPPLLRPPLPPIDPHEETRALRAAQRSPGYLALFFVASAVVACLPLVPDLGPSLGLRFTQTAVGIGLIDVLVLTATLAYHRFGADSLAYRLCLVPEGLGIFGVAMWFIYSSGRGDSFLWLIYFTYAFVNARNTEHRRLVQWGLGLPPAVLALAFLVLRGDVVSAIQTAFAGVLGSLIFLAGLRSSRKMAALQAERQRIAGELAELHVQAERQRIARDLHDGLAADLTAVAWRAQRVGAELGAGEPGQALTSIVERATQGIDELRSVVWALRSPTRRWGELVDHLRQRGEELCEGRASFVLDDRGVGDRERRIDGEASLHCVRVVQESVRNAVRHARPSTVRVTLVQGPPMVLRIDDDGDGLPDGAQPSGGLVNLRRRAAALDAELRIEPLAPGTRVELRGALPDEPSE